MSSKSWYVLRAKNVPARYGMSKNIQTLLQALDRYHTGGLDAVELGRLVRLSPKRRAAIADTIKKCAEMIKKQPEELKTCVDIIEMCTEILEVADRPPPSPGFPFMRLPLEIRDAIIHLMIDNAFWQKGLLPVKKKTTCNCPEIERGYPLQTPLMRSLPSLLGRAMSTEFFRIFFRKKTFRFRCCCELIDHLQQNKELLRNVREIMVHWCGPVSDEAFLTLAKCGSLETLTLSISKATLAQLSERSEFMRAHFPLIYRNVRITDVLGLDELLNLRGLKAVAVKHAQSKHSNHISEMDRANLAELLSSQLKQLKEPDLARLTLPYSRPHRLENSTTFSEDYEISALLLQPETTDHQRATATTEQLPIMSLVSGEKSNFQFILRLLNTNVDGKQKVMYALTKIKGVGRRYSNLVCKKADVDLNKRAGELTSEELERIVTIIQNPTQYKIPSWFLNRQRDIVDGKDSQVLANGVDSKLRDDLERLKKIRAHRGLRHYWGLRVRGQHTKTTGRRGRTVGVSKKKGG
ncbi:hypothetical protein G7046_g4383 [Stylonectria norvegica]|nr:hypothetical protein G7046_g4383 [Stylonectria norvegica]